jgi:spore coat polysaccharide biosynthesis protein SpsF
MNSTRLRGKVMMPLGGTPVLGWVWRAAAAAHLVDSVWIATTTEERDNVIVEWCIKNKMNYWRGSEDDVLDRFVDCAKQARADAVVRLTGDCCLLPPQIIDEVITLYLHTGVAYASNVDPPSYPDGFDVQVVATEALFAAHKLTARASDRDTVCCYISRHRDRYPSANLVCPIPGLASERFVLDTAEDFAFCQAVAEKLPYAAHYPPSMIEMLTVLRKHPELRQINSMHTRNERFFAAIANEVP